MARPAPPSDDGSPARLIATMVGIVGILLLGSLAWSAIGALVSAVGSAGSALTTARTAPPTFAPPVAVTPSPVMVITPVVAPMATALPTSAAVASPTTELAPATPTPVTAGRNPWILLPQPEPGARVTPGPVTVEARGRGDAPIKAIGLELDGTSLPVALEQRSESTWRGSATTRLGAGQHTVRATVTDSEGRNGSFRWTFTVGAPP